MPEILGCGELLGEEVGEGEFSLLLLTLLLPLLSLCELVRTGVGCNSFKEPGGEYLLQNKIINITVQLLVKYIEF